MSRRKPVRKRIVIVPTPVLGEAKGQAPSRIPDPADPPVPLDLLPPLRPDVRAKFVDVLADIANAELEASVNTADSAKESTKYRKRNGR